MSGELERRQEHQRLDPEAAAVPIGGSGCIDSAVRQLRCNASSSATIAEPVLIAADVGLGAGSGAQCRVTVAPSHAVLIICAHDGAMAVRGSGDATELVKLATQVEELSLTDTHSAAAKLDQLATAVQAVREQHDTCAASHSVPLPSWAEGLDGALVDLAHRIHSGHVKGVSGLERRIRQFLLALGFSEAQLGAASPPRI